MNQIPLEEIAVRLISSAEEAGVEMRIAGSVGTIVISKGSVFQRPAAIKDIDLVTLLVNRRKVQTFLKQLGWRISDEFLLLSELRESYSRSDEEFTIDVYYNQIDGSHRINLQNRLDLSSPTITLTDLLLSKLQRQYMRPVDIWDACVLLGVKDHLIDFRYFDALVGNDWGLFTTVSENLVKLSSECSFQESKIRMLRDSARTCKKSFRWCLRSVFGRRFRWWEEISDGIITR